MRFVRFTVKRVYIYIYIIGKYVTHCRELPKFKYGHDLVTNVLFIFMRVGISVKKMESINFLTNLQERYQHFGERYFGAWMAR
jgi:hypothetical protein